MTFIAIVDDRASNRRIWAQLAASVEPTAVIETFEEPVSALERLQDVTPDLVITDFQMPKMNGAQFIKALRSRGDTKEVPVVVVSVYEDRQFRYQALESGATDFLMSPVDHFEFRTRVRNLLTLRRQQLLLRRKAIHLEEELKTETARHAQTLRNSSAQLLSVVDTLPAIVYAADKYGRCKFMNRYGADLFGVGYNKIENVSVSDLVPHSWAEQERDRDRQLLNGTSERAVFEDEIVGGDGVRGTYLVTKALMKDAVTGENNILTVAMDISERKLMEIELSGAKEAAEAANVAKTNFLANMSHELRTPLNAVIGFSEMMIGEHLGPIGNAKYLEYVRDINSSANHLLHIITDVLDLSKVEVGKLSLSNHEFDLARSLGELAGLFRREADEKDIMVKVEISPDLPPIRADRVRFKQIFLNLLSNAMKFSEPGGFVCIAAGLTADGSMKVEVQDNGIGMTAEQIDIAMERFGQVSDDHTNRKYQGTGLGLPIACALTELHDGDFSIESQPGQGTKVCVTIPPDRVLKTAMAM